MTQRDSNSNMQGWASISGFSSVMQPYWHIYDVEHARREARIRLQTGPNEVDQRGRAIMTRKCGGLPGMRAERIEERNLRACYLCEAVQGQHGVYMPESSHHMLIMCPNVKMVALRVKLKADLLLLCATEDGLREHPIPELSQSVMWSLLLLCTTSESFPIQARRSVRRREALDAVGTRDELPVFDRDEVVAAVNWLSPLVEEWMGRLRQYHKVGDTAALPGAKVVALICAHISQVFTVRRKVLSDNIEYWARSRDPVASL